MCDHAYNANVTELRIMMAQVYAVADRQTRALVGLSLVRRARTSRATRTVPSTVAADVSSKEQDAES